MPMRPAGERQATRDHQAPERVHHHLPLFSICLPACMHGGPVLPSVAASRCRFSRVRETTLATRKAPHALTAAFSEPHTAFSRRRRPPLDDFAGLRPVNARGDRGRKPRDGGVRRVNP